MSFESVRNKCLINDPELDIAKVDEWIQKEANQFDKAAKARMNISRSFFAMTTKEGETVAQVRNEFAKKHRVELAHDYLKFLCDLYDYLPEVK